MKQTQLKQYNELVANGKNIFTLSSWNPTPGATIIDELNHDSLKSCITLEAGVFSS